MDCELHTVATVFPPDGTNNLNAAGQAEVFVLKISHSLILSSIEV